MSDRDVPLLLQDIQDAIYSILTYTNGYTFITYEEDARTKHAVERNFEIIGEAISRIPDDFKELHTYIEWRIIKDFRNFIIHDYFGINNRIVWDTIQLRLPDLLKDITALKMVENKLAAEKLRNENISKLLEKKSQGHKPGGHSL